MIFGTFNARRGSQQLEQNLEVFMSRTTNTLFNNIKKFTPKRSGKAAKSWRKTKMNKFDHNLVNNQTYVPRLDKGYSKQAPRGFYKPAVTQTQRTNKGRFYK